MIGTAGSSWCFQTCLCSSDLYTHLKKNVLPQPVFGHNTIFSSFMLLTHIFTPTCEKVTGLCVSQVGVEERTGPMAHVHHMAHQFTTTRECEIARNWSDTGRVKCTKLETLSEHPLEDACAQKTISVNSIWIAAYFSNSVKCNVSAVFL